MTPSLNNGAEGIRREDILYEKQDGVAIATLNRPHSLNAFRQSTMQEFLQILSDVAADSQIRVLVVTGNGRAFSAGRDLKEWALSEGDLSAQRLEGELELLQNITQQMMKLSKVLIAAVNGVAVGLGAEIAIACDIRLASESAVFGFPEAQRGLFVTNGVTYFLPRLVGMGRATEWLLTGEMILAPEALHAGLVTHVVPLDDLMKFTMTLSRKITANAPISIRLIKQAMQKTYELDLAAAMQLETNGVLECHDSEDFPEGVRAFVEKRAPVYRGK
jgi:enoyl-CoA hydratase/carnithine racemase